MASSGKKGKKTKGKTIALTDFLQETPGATPTIPIRKTNLNWADEVEDVCNQYDRPKANVVLPTAPKASRGLDEFSERIPQQPPYIAYLSNLPYDVNEDEIANFFGGLKISNMRIPKDDRPGDVPRLKGFGYVEFEDRDSLVGALSITDCTLKNRRIRIEIATNLDNDRRRGGRMDNNRDRSDRSEITSGDWRSGPRSEPTEPERNRGGGGGGGGGGFNRDRDRDNNERDNRGGSWRDASNRPILRDNDRNSGHRDGYGDRSRFNDRDGEKRGFGPRRNDDREFVRGGSRDDGGPERSEPRTRPKLVLAPRTKPVESVPVNTDREASQETNQTTSVPASSSIFGSAKPVDTSIRERQIEDRLAKAQEGELDRGSRRDNERRDWGKKEDDDSKWQGKRHDSPKRYSSPPNRRNSTDSSPPRTRDSPRGYSPVNRRRDCSPQQRTSYDRRRNSSDNKSPSRSSSPDYRKSSPERRSSSDYSKHSPTRKHSPDDRRNSLERDRGGSPYLRKDSPDRRRISPDRKDGSLEQRRQSPSRRRDFVEHKKVSPDRRRNSPDKWKRSPDRQTNRGSFQKKHDDKERRGGGAGATRNERPVQKNDKLKRDDKVSKDIHEKDMPKLKEPEAPNFAASNKFAFLQAESDSD